MGPSDMYGFFFCSYSLSSNTFPVINCNDNALAAHTLKFTVSEMLYRSIHTTQFTTHKELAKVSACVCVWLFIILVQHIGHKTWTANSASGFTRTPPTLAENKMRPTIRLHPLAPVNPARTLARSISTAGKGRQRPVANAVHPCIRLL